MGLLFPEQQFNLVVGNNNIIWNSDVLKAIVEMCLEHYIPKMKDTCLCVDFSNPVYITNWKKIHPEQKIIFYNLEHKYPLDENNNPHNCSQEWNNFFKGTVPGLFDEIWDFNIENYVFWESLGLADKFRFMPLRYTTWFEQFRQNITPHYDIEFEGIFTTVRRLQSLATLTCPVAINQSQCIRLKIANTSDPSVKYMEKQTAKYCIDLPQYDNPETINSTRIHECICMNRPVIVYDEYKAGSRKYWDDLCIYIENLSNVDVWNITHQEPRTDVADVYKGRTYTDDAFQQYRKEIKEDFEKINNIKIPDSVLL